MPTWHVECLNNKTQDVDASYCEFGEGWVRFMDSFGELLLALPTRNVIEIKRGSG